MEKSFTCTYCNKTFSMNFELIIHMRTHSGGNPYQCNNCTCAFSTQGDLISHIESHIGDKPYQDKPVDKTTLSTSILTTSSKHQPRAYYGDKITWEKERFYCHHCGNSYSEKCALVVHLRNHTGENPYKCSQCHKAFKVKRTLEGHLRTHSGEKPFQCTQCDRCFSIKGNLSRHLVSHSGEKSYHCRQCDKWFLRKSTLAKHMKTHTREKPKVCVVENNIFFEQIYIKKLSELPFEANKEELISGEIGIDMKEPRIKLEETKLYFDANKITNSRETKVEVKEEPGDPVVNTNIYKQGVN